MNSKKAFTLIEVLISLALFASLSISLTQVINQTTRSQKQIENIVKKNRLIKNTSYLIQKDIKNSLRTTNTFHWAYDSYARCLMNQFGSLDLLQDYMSSEDQSFFQSSQAFPLMQMEGESDFLFFAQVSPQGVLQKIEYILEDCVNEEEENVSCLVRKTSEIIDDIDRTSEETLKTVPLVKNVDELIFSYYDFETKDWKDRLEVQTKNPFAIRTLEHSRYFPFSLPFAIKVELKIDDSDLRINIPIESAFLSEKIKMEDTFKPIGSQCSNLGTSNSQNPTSSTQQNSTPSNPQNTE